jgi:hypothetical protein
MTLTLEISVVFLGRERRTTEQRLATRAASRPNLLARRGLHPSLGILLRPVRTQSRWHKVQHLRPQTSFTRGSRQRRQ